MFRAPTLNATDKKMKKIQDKLNGILILLILIVYLTCVTVAQNNKILQHLRTPTQTQKIETTYEE